MLRIVLSSIAVITSASSAILAQAPTPPVKEKRVCRSAASIGTLVPQRTCHTSTEWKEIDAANDRAMQQMRQENNPGANQPPN